MHSSTDYTFIMIIPFAEMINENVINMIQDINNEFIGKPMILEVVESLKYELSNLLGSMNLLRDEIAIMDLRDSIPTPTIQGVRVLFSFDY